MLTVTTLASCTFYVIGTYLANDYDVVVIVIESTFSLVFLVDFVLSLIAAPVGGTPLVGRFKASDVACGVIAQQRP